MVDNRELLYNTILVGLTCLDSSNTLTNQGQFFGTITEIADTWLAVEAGHDKVKRIPMDLILHTPRGTCRCLATAQIINDPDYLTSWVLGPNTDTLPPMLCKSNYAPAIDPLSLITTQSPSPGGEPCLLERSPIVT